MTPARESLIVGILNYVVKAWYSITETHLVASSVSVAMGTNCPIGGD